MFCCLEDPEPEYPQHQQPYASYHPDASLTKPYYGGSTRYSTSPSSIPPRMGELEQRNRDLQVQVNNKKQ